MYLDPIQCSLWLTRGLDPVQWYQRIYLQRQVDLVHALGQELGIDRDQFLALVVGVDVIQVEVVDQCVCMVLVYNQHQQLLFEYGVKQEMPLVVVAVVAVVALVVAVVALELVVELMA